MPRKETAPVETVSQTAGELRARILGPAKEELGRIREAETGARQEISALQDAHAEQMQEWRQKAEQARQAYQPEPPAPEQPNIRQQQALLHRMVTAKQAVHAMERKALANAKWEVETEWGQTLPALALEAQEALRPLQALLGRVRSWQALLKDSRSAYETQDGMRPQNGMADRMISDVTLTDLVRLAEGFDLLAPSPLPPRPEAASRPLAPGQLEGERFVSRVVAADRERRRLNGGRPGW